MLCSHARSETIRSSEGDIARLGTTGHVMCFSGRVDDLVDSLHGEIECHELAL